MYRVFGCVWLVVVGVLMRIVVDSYSCVVFLFVIWCCVLHVVRCLLCVVV